MNAARRFILRPNGHVAGWCNNSFGGPSECLSSRCAHAGIRVASFSIGVAQTGSGKTLGYLLPAAMHIQAQPKSQLRGPTALVLAPTRELVQQITAVAHEWLTSTFGLRSIGVYGGSHKGVQVGAFRDFVLLLSFLTTNDCFFPLSEDLFL